MVQSIVTPSSDPLAVYVRGLSPTNQAPFVKYARMYLDYSGGIHDRATVETFLAKLRKSGFKDSSLDFIFRIIRTLFRRNGWEWEFRRSEGPQVQEDQVDAPALDTDLIGEMIIAAKSGVLTPEEAAYLSLSTIYGLRRTELGALTQADVNLADKTLYVATAKHGRARTHMIPSQLIPTLSLHEFRPVSNFRLQCIWEFIEYRIGFTHIQRVGWHSIRRTLISSLLDYLAPYTVYSFLRWKQASSQDMLFRYSAVRFIGRGASTTRVFGEAQDVDQKVFEVHPFLALWEGVKPNEM